MVVICCYLYENFELLFKEIKIVVYILDFYKGKDCYV